MSESTVSDAALAPLRAILSACLPAGRAARYSQLIAGSEKQRHLFLNALHHDFEPREDRSEPFEMDPPSPLLLPLDKPCRAYHASVEFADEFPTLLSAFETLAPYDAWLIVLDDATAAFYRPEDHWDDQRMLTP